MVTVLSALDGSVPIGSSVTIAPSQSLAYPFGWIGSCLTFIAVRPPWLRQEVPRRDSIHLILTEDDLGTSVGLVAYNEEGPPGVTTEYKLEEPYYLFGGEAHCTVGLSWGTSARRMVYAVDTSDEVFLCGVSIPLDPTGLESRIPGMTRAVAEWPIPNGANDLPYHLVFEESTGVSAVAMASGRIWIMDPCAVVGGAENTWNTPDMVRLMSLVAVVFTCSNYSTLGHTAPSGSPLASYPSYPMAYQHGLKRGPDGRPRFNSGLVFLRRAVLPG